MSISRSLLFAIAACALAACSGSTPPSSFSNDVRTSSGIGATGSAGPQGGPGGVPASTGNISTTRVQ